MRVQSGWWLGAVMLLALPITAQTATPDAKKPPAQAAPTPAPAADPFAFPEDDSKTKNLEPVPVPAGPDTSGYSSSNNGSADTPPAGSAPDADSRRKLELRDEGSAGHIDTARSTRDETVADFYEKDGNYMGAYLRYKDAVVFNPDNAYDHFQLARLARKMGKTDEAIGEYKATVKLDPQGKYAKDASRILAEMQNAAQKK